MFEELLFMIGFAIVSILISYLLREYSPNPIDKIVKALAIIGIIIHELCHIIMCIITNTKIHSYSLIERVDKKDGRRNMLYGGRVTINDTDRLTFLQALLIALAPIYLSFWLFYFLLEQLLYANVSELMFFIILLIMISIILGASPSLVDLLSIPKAFNRDPQYSIYQIFLLLLSGATVWFIITMWNIYIVHDIIFYIVTFFGYYGFKYGFKVIYSFLRPKGIKYKKLYRKRLKPIRPKK